MPRLGLATTLAALLALGSAAQAGTVAIASAPQKVKRMAA